MIKRSKYLNMCRECAMLKEKGLYGVRKNVPERLRVVWRGVEHYPVSYELAFWDDGSINHIAVIHDLKANSICHVPLKDVYAKVVSSDED